ncbi:competence type IV pilus minor pilin ComGF [Allofustis seminis]|uniref:competence type IV pilus minor pilin ComGF n=1 Tax=Allofustis seminis TaxID=166939 RepID=UPI0014615FFB|nr:competence type IV pilus minor pilin ComGF [Allofustis seminis]
MFKLIWHSRNDCNIINQQSGFTLLEALVALLITSTIFLLMASGIFQGKLAQPLAEDQEQIEWHLFLNQWEAYLNDAEFEKLTRRQLTTKEKAKNKKKSETFTYKKSGQAFVRTKNYGGGYQPLLLNVAYVEFARVQGQIEITVSFINGKTRVGKIYVESWEDFSDEKQ